MSQRPRTRTIPRFSYRNLVRLENMLTTLSTGNVAMSVEVRAHTDETIKRLRSEVDTIKDIRNQVLREVCCPRCKSAELTVMGPDGEEVRAT